MAENCDHAAAAGASLGEDAYLRLLCQHTGVAVVATDPALRITFWNAAASRLFGAAAQPMLGTTLLSVIPQDSRAEAERMLQQSLTEGTIGGFEFCYRDGQGHRRYLAATISPVVNDAGVIIGTSACIRDITNRIVLTEQVARSRKMASLGAMAGAVAHYFNNILGGAITSVDFALASDNPTMQKRVLEQTAKALGRAASLSDGLLTFAEGDFHTADLADLTETFMGVTDVTEQELAGSNITMEVRAEAIPVTAVPSVQFRTALHNVIQNAIEAMPDGGRLTVALARTEDGFSVRVTDTGCGVPEELQDRIFEPLYSTKAEADARPGLGLAVAHGIVQTMGGGITITSKVGEGSTFEIKLPIHPKLPAGKS
jgi:two-component system, cell cycle sensor histidine kinase and response regulator CckA